MVVGRSRLGGLAQSLAEEAQHEVVFILLVMVIRDAEAVNVWAGNVPAHWREAQAARVVFMAFRYSIVARLPHRNSFYRGRLDGAAGQPERLPQDAGHE
jgi:hypothetical protein